ncbi:MAG: hypothetical protein QNJ14_14875 [Woeseiaceae bacterium]|nr:hypothetical protein [Woeseiaceae bacterium]
MKLNCVFALLLVLASNSAVASDDWIYGTWWYADSSGRIVEGKDKDGMRFASDGTVDLIYGSGKTYLTCRYAVVTDAQLNVDCIVRGEERRLKFVIDSDQQRLAAVEDKDNGFYRR